MQNQPANGRMGEWANGRTVCCFLCGFLLLSGGWTQRTSETAEGLFGDMQQVTTTATRSRHTLYESFTTVRVLTREELRLAGVQTVQEALERSVAALESQEGSVHRFLSVRGAYSSSEFNERTLILLDGVPLNDPMLGNFSLMMLPVIEVERIEIAFGPGSALYGPNAFAGVINIITRSPDLMGGSEFRGLYASRDGINSAIAYSSGPNPRRFAYSVGGAFWRDPGSDQLSNNDTVVRHLSFTGTWAPADGSSWNLQYRFFGMDRGSVGLRYLLAGTPRDRFRPDLHVLQVERRKESLRSKQVVRLYGTVGTLTFHRESPPGSGQIDRTRFDQSTVALESLWQLEKGSALLTGGFELRVYWGRGELLNGSQSASNQSLFAQAEWTLGKWRPLVGLRYDTHSVYGAQYSPRAGMTYRINEGWILRASYGKAFRAPNFSELFLNGFIIWLPTDTGLVPLRLYGTPTLKPETMEAFEVGLKGSLPGGWRTDIAYFHNEIEGAISIFNIDPNDPLKRVYRNLQSFTPRGWSIEIAKLVNAHLDLSVGYVRTEEDENQTRDDDLFSPHRLILKAALRNVRNWKAQLLVGYPAKLIGTKQAYGMLTSLNLSYQPDSKTEWSLRVDNLFNVPNEIAWRVPGGGRNFWLQFSRRW